MARQGNYVTVNGNANWAEGISRSLLDLSKSFRQQGESEDERARLAAAQEESNRRFGIEQAAKELEAQRTADYRTLTLENAAEEARLAAENRNKTLGIQQQQADLAKQRYDEEQKLLKEAEEQRRILSGLDVGGKSFDMLSPFTKDQFSTEEARLESYEKEAQSAIPTILERRGYKDEEGNLTSAGRDFFNSRLIEYKDSLIPSEAQARALNDVNTLYTNAVANTLPEDAPKYLQTRREDLFKGKDRAADLVTQNEALRTYQKQLADKGFLDAYSTETEKELRSRLEGLGIRTAEDIAAGINASAKAEYDRNIEIQKLKLDYFDKISDSIKSGGSSSGTSAKEFAQGINELDTYGNDEKLKANALVNALKNDPEVKAAGISDDILRTAVLYGAVGGLEGMVDSLPSISPDNIDKTLTPFIDAAKAMSTSRFVPKVKRPELEIPEFKTVTAADIRAGRADKAYQKRDWQGKDQANRETPPIGLGELPSYNAPSPTVDSAAFTRDILNRATTNLTGPQVPLRPYESAVTSTLDLPNRPIPSPLSIGGVSLPEQPVTSPYRNVDLGGTIREALTPAAPNDFSAGDLNLNPQEQRAMVALSNRSTGYLEDILSKSNATELERRLIPIILQSRQR